MMDVSAEEQHPITHLRGGHTVVVQEPSLTLTETRTKNGFQIVAGYDHTNQATGDFYLDDGISTNMTTHLYITFSMTIGSINIDVHDNGQFCASLSSTFSQTSSKNADLSVNTLVESIILYGLLDKPEGNTVTVWANSSQLAAIHNPDVQYDNSLGVMSIKVSLDLCAQSQYELRWNYTVW